MKEPIWLLEEAMQAVHERVIAEFGGAGGVRDAGRLFAALMRPQQAYAYEVTDLFVLAASYAHAIVKGHPFVDGNKRTGLLAALVFLECNGVEFHAPQQQVVQATLALAAGEDLEQESFAEWLRSSGIICGGIGQGKRSSRRENDRIPSLVSMSLTLQ